jgi:site-specific DNA-cytosine methylase
MLRTLHLTAVMQPWWVWLENVKAIEQVKNGRVWVVIKEIAQAVGYVVRLRQV